MPDCGHQFCTVVDCTPHCTRHEVIGHIFPSRSTNSFLEAQHCFCNWTTTLVADATGHCPLVNGAGPIQTSRIASDHRFTHWDGQRERQAWCALVPTNLAQFMQRWTVMSLVSIARWRVHFTLETGVTRRQNKAASPVCHFTRRHYNGRCCCDYVTSISQLSWVLPRTIMPLTGCPWLR